MEQVRGLERTQLWQTIGQYIQLLFLIFCSSQKNKNSKYTWEISKVYIVQLFK